MRFVCNQSACLILVVACFASTGCQMMARGHNVEGTRLYKSGQLRNALDSFEMAAESDPQNADAHYNMAATLHTMGVQRRDSDLVQRAEELYNKALDLDPDHADTYRGLAVLLADTGQSDRAFKLMKGWALRSPRNADARIELARLHHEAGQDATSELLLHDALKLNVKNPRAWAALGSLREGSGDQQQALANYRKSLALNQLQPGLVNRVARLNRFGPVNASQEDRPGTGTRTVDQNWIPRKY